MKVGIIVRKLNVKGGVQRQALSVARELRSNGHVVRLYTFTYSTECFPELIEDIAINVLPTNLHLPTDGIFGLLGEYRMARRLARMIDRDLDILHPHDSGAHIVSFFYKLYVKNIPSVWYMNELSSMRWPPKLLSYVEDPEYHAIPRRSLLIKKISILLKTMLERFFIVRQDLILVLSNYHRDLLRHYTGKDSIVIHSGVDVEKFPYQEHALYEKGKELLLLSNGIFMPYRRYEDIVLALPFLIEMGYNPKLFILGAYETDGFYHQALINLADRLKVLNRVVFFGSYTDVELLGFLMKSHIFVFPHLQSQGLSVYEAMAVGLPSIVAPLLNTYETVEDGRDIIKVPPKDPLSIALAVNRLCVDRELYRALSVNGARLMREKLTWRAYALAIERELEKLVLNPD